MPFIEAAGELKTKPTQHSVNELRRIGIHPDIVVCRSHEPLSDEIREKIALFADVDVRAVIGSPDVPDVYLVPEGLQREGLDELVCERLGLNAPPAVLGEWKELTDLIVERRENVEIALVGKYVKLHDAYLSVHEALKHAGMHQGAKVHVRWFDSENMTYEEAVEELETADGVLVPGGFGSRGWEGKILACRVAREQGIPYLGICLGMHVAVSEFARHVCGLEGANSTEMDPETPFPVIDLLPEQKEIEDLGGTMRLGAQAVELGEGTRTREIYGEATIHERHRHRYEVNNQFRDQLVGNGLVVSGTFQEGRLVEIVELPEHPWFVASQFHPSSSRARRGRRRSSAASSAPPSSGRGRGAVSLSRRRAERDPPALPRALRDPEPIRRGAGGRRSRLPRARADRARVGRGRCGSRRRFDDGQHRLPPARALGRGDADLPLRPPRHGAARRPDRARRRGRRRAKRRRHDPRRRQQVRGRRDARSSTPDRGREQRSTPVSSCSSRRRRRSGCSAPSRSTTRGSKRGSGTSTTRPRRSARSSSAPRAQKSIKARFHGRASHAGMYPEEGRSAIFAASRAIADMRLGRIDHQSSANVGVIEGGTARNIVPEWCSIDAEARSRDPKTLAVLVQEMLDAIGFAAAISDCTVETEIEDSYRGYEFGEDEPAVVIAAEGLRRAGYEPTTAFSGGAADANVFNERGLPCVNLANAMADIHTADEHIAVVDLEGMVEVTLAIVEAARTA